MILPVLALCLSLPPVSQDVAEADTTPTLAVEDWLVIEPLERRGRRPFAPDAVFAKHLLEPESKKPRRGAVLRGESGEEREWTAVTPDAEGWVQGSIGYAFGELESLTARVMLARLEGASRLYVNGQAFAGDGYRFGFGGVPVPLREGINHIWVSGVRGGFHLEFRPCEPLFIADWDTTYHDLVRDQPVDGEIGLLIVNATERWQRGVRVNLMGTTKRDFAEPLRSKRIDLGPCSVAKLPVPLRFPDAFAPPNTTEPVTFALQLEALGRNGAVQPFELEVPVREVGTAHRRTFRSAVDDSVQGYALVIPEKDYDAERGAGLILSLHGAGVTALGQANCYQRKSDFWVVAPTNRRPFGFDWQDWGRIDAYEALAAALEVTGVDRRRVYLTGHSMGGHGTWHLAANDLDGFAAIAPSAGWESFDTYGGRPAGALSDLWHGADGASLTRHFIGNLAQLPTYVLHGSSDDNVPVTEAEGMLAKLRAAGAEPAHHFEEGAGHWWGNRCVDWPAFAEMFRDERIPAFPMELDFTTADPGVDFAHHWLEVWQPREYGRPIHMTAKLERDGTIRVDTENARLFRVAAPNPARVKRYLIDGTAFEAAGVADRGWFQHDGKAWRRSDKPEGQKTPTRSGPFKRAFDNQFVMVVGTGGADHEDAALYARARQDAADWWYRGNGRAPIVTDTYFAAADYSGRNVILYGNRDTNQAWDRVLGDDCPIDVRRKKITVGEVEYEGRKLGCAFVYPRKDETETLVGVFGDTGAAGARLGFRLAPFVSGVGYPDYAIFSADVLTKGDGGVLDAGWFDWNWGLAERADPR